MSVCGDRLAENKLRREKMEDCSTNEIKLKNENCND